LDPSSGSKNQVDNRYSCVSLESLLLTKTTGLVITKRGSWIVHDKCWSPILIQIKRSSVKVGISLYFSERQFSNLVFMPYTLTVSSL